MIQSFMRLTRDEAFAIRYHMGFSGNEDKNSVGRALEMFLWRWRSMWRIWRQRIIWKGL